MRTLTSDEINFLILRYLQESGFKHTAFTFSNEAILHKSPINGSDIPPGALISFLQKGLQYLEIEAKISKKQHDKDYKNETSIDLLNEHLKQKYGPKEPRRSEENIKKEDKMELDDLQDSTRILDSKVTVLKGHTHEVFICAWNPKNANVLASGSGDSTARIWTLPPGPCGKDVVVKPPIILRHSNDTPGSSKDVTTLDWSVDGTMLATGSYDGKARIWTEDGVLLRTLDKHKGPIFSLKWNKRGDYLLSGSVDNTAIIWDVKTGEVKQQFKHHTAPTLDVDWRTDTTFATCSTDKMIYVCKLGEEKPTRVFQGHEDEVNAIRWDPSGTLLASCSDDFTAKIWNMKSDKCIYDFKEHTKEIYTIKWSPTGRGTANPNKDLILASASFDATIKLWDVNVGKCLYSLTKHSEPVYSVSFSPNGEYLASGSFDRCLHIWSVKDGKLVRKYRGSGSIFEVCWNSTGDKVAACFSNSITEDFTVCVIDFRM